MSLSRKVAAERAGARFKRLADEGARLREAAEVFHAAGLEREALAGLYRAMELLQDALRAERLAQALERQEGM